MSNILFDHIRREQKMTDFYDDLEARLYKKREQSEERFGKEFKEIASNLEDYINIGDCFMSKYEIRPTGYIFYKGVNIEVKKITKKMVEISSTNNAYIGTRITGRFDSCKLSKEKFLRYIYMNDVSYERNLNLFTIDQNE